MTGPGVYVLEAPMGMGQTEAVIYAAYKYLEAVQARGIYYSLPGACEHCAQLAAEQSVSIGLMLFRVTMRRRAR